MHALSLMYHDVVEGNDWDQSGFPGPWPAAYKLTRPEFQSHLDAIRQTINTTSFAAVDRFTEWARIRPVFITFDDGGVSAAAPIASMLEEIGCPGHFFVTTDYIGKPGFLDASQIRDLRRRGHVIGSHSCSHPRRMAACSMDQLRFEWTESIRKLSDLLNEPVKVASVPGGYYSPQVGETAAEAGVRFLFTSEPTDRVSMLGPCQLFGRYAIKQRTPATTAALYAGGDRMTLWKDSLLWSAKKMVKSVGGPLWVMIGERVHK